MGNLPEAIIKTDIRQLGRIDSTYPLLVECNENLEIDLNHESADPKREQELIFDYGLVK